MAKDVLYTNGVIAVKEKNLLGDKILRLCESGEEEAFRMLVESGFGGGTEVESVRSFEALIAAEENALDAFIREYSPTEAEKVYLLSERDFHNAKALVKAEHLSAETEKMLAPEGLIPVKDILSCIRSADFEPLGERLNQALSATEKLFAEAAERGEGNAVSGAEIGRIFARAAYAELISVCGKKPVLKKLITARIDMANILGAMRAASAESAENAYITGGKLSFKQISGVFGSDAEHAANCLKRTPYADFYASCLKAKESGRPFTQAEKILASYEKNFFEERKYELERSEPFLYYAFRRRAEIENVRIVFVCLAAGMEEQEIKSRLRAL